MLVKDAIIVNRYLDTLPLTLYYGLVTGDYLLEYVYALKSQLVEANLEEKAHSNTFESHYIPFTFPYGEILPFAWAYVI